MIDATHDEIDFIRRIAARGGEISLRGNFKHLKIDRLIPSYVMHVSTSKDIGVLSLTQPGWELARSIERKYPLRGGAPF